jgi:hypothetical protein
MGALTRETPHRAGVGRRKTARGRMGRGQRRRTRNSRDGGRATPTNCLLLLLLPSCPQKECARQCRPKKAGRPGRHLGMHHAGTHSLLSLLHISAVHADARGLVVVRVEHPVYVCAPTGQLNRCIRLAENPLSVASTCGKEWGGREKHWVKALVGTGRREDVTDAIARAGECRTRNPLGGIPRYMYIQFTYIPRWWSHDCMRVCVSVHAE